MSISFLNKLKTSISALNHHKIEFIKLIGMFFIVGCIVVGWGYFWGVSFACAVTALVLPWILDIYSVTKLFEDNVVKIKVIACAIATAAYVAILGVFEILKEIPHIHSIHDLIVYIGIAMITCVGIDAGLVVVKDLIQTHGKLHPKKETNSSDASI